jgi:hypothetical protein
MSMRQRGSHLVMGAVVVSCAGLGLLLVPGSRGRSETLEETPPVECPVHANTLSWPDVNPVWTMCWTQPKDTAKDIDGSGLRLSHVFYKGKKVLDQASLPCMNVLYTPGSACDNTKCCGTDLPTNVHTFSYRDWLTQYAPFVANNVLIKPIVDTRNPDKTHTRRPGYAEPTEPARTLCDQHPNPGKDVGDFYGVAVEKRSDRLVMTTALESGWYRYTQKWIFFPDGTIEPRIAFTAVDNACTGRPHHHNAYWRFDFDIGDPENDVIEELNDSKKVETLATEVSRPNDPDRHRRWRVLDKSTNRGYEVIPSPIDGVADDWGVADMWALRYKGTREHDDGGFRANHVDGARTHVSDFLNAEPIDGEDLVMWYHAGHMHKGGITAGCDPELIGPTLKPFGKW